MIVSWTNSGQFFSLKMVRKYLFQIDDIRSYSHGVFMWRRNQALSVRSIQNGHTYLTNIHHMTAPSRCLALSYTLQNTNANKTGTYPQTLSYLALYTSRWCRSAPQFNLSSLHLFHSIILHSQTMLVKSFCTWEHDHHRILWLFIMKTSWFSCTLRPPLYENGLKVGVTLSSNLHLNGKSIFTSSIQSVI